MLMRTDSVQHFSSLEAYFNGLVQSSVKLVEMFQLKALNQVMHHICPIDLWRYINIIL